MTCIVMSGMPKTVRVRYACGDEVNEQEITLSKTRRYVVKIVKRYWAFMPVENTMRVIRETKRVLGGNCVSSSLRG